MSIENKNYKDTVFRMIFNDKRHLLELYNAINRTSYNNLDDLTITTLEGETFLKMKNDVSFIINFELNLFEHQSTICPNIPLRDLYYLAATLKDMYSTPKTYSQNLLRIPTPRFFVFYNGLSKMDDKVTFKLSDMFSHKVDDPSIELSVTAFNVNEGHNKELMEACKTLKGYSIFVSKVRKYKKEAEDDYNRSHPVPLSQLVDKTEITKQLVSQAVNNSINYCIDQDILKDFFTSYRKEVVEMGVIEYSAEEHIQVIKDESYDSGVADAAAIFAWLVSSGRADDVQEAANNPDFLKQITAEFKACHGNNSDT